MTKYNKCESTYIKKMLTVDKMIHKRTRNYCTALQGRTWYEEFLQSICGARYSSATCKPFHDPTYCFVDSELFLPLMLLSAKSSHTRLHQTVEKG